MIPNALIKTNETGEFLVSILHKTEEQKPITSDELIFEQNETNENAEKSIFNKKYQSNAKIERQMRNAIQGKPRVFKK